VARAARRSKAQWSGRRIRRSNDRRAELVSGRPAVSLALHAGFLTCAWLALAAAAIPLTRSPRGSEVFYALAALVSAASVASAVYAAIGTLPLTKTLSI